MKTLSFFSAKTHNCVNIFSGSIVGKELSHSLLMRK